MILVSFYRILKFAWQGFLRNFWLSIITISIIVLVLFTVNFLIILNIVTDSAINDIQNKIDISIYFQKDVKEEKVLEVKDYLSSLSQIQEIKYISQQQALDDFRQRHKNDLVILQSLSELDSNPLGATLIIEAKQISDYPQITTFLNNSKYNNLVIDKNFEDHKVFINKIKDISDRINNAGIVVTSIFIFIAILIVFNTIRVAIYTHKDEIAIMRLVGANNIFISMPFVIEGVIYSILGLAISLAILYPLLNFIQPYLSNFFTGSVIDLGDYFDKNYFIFVYEFIGVVLLNIIGSMIAIRRYLDV